MGVYEDLLAAFGAQMDADRAATNATLDEILTAALAGTNPEPEPGPNPDEPPPIPDRAGHTEIWRDEFNGMGLDPAKWGNPYSGEFKSTAGSKAEPSNVFVADGMLQIKSVWRDSDNKVTTGGLKSKLYLPGTGGWMECAMRQDPGVAKTAVMLYPQSGWPPEIDYLEMGGDVTQVKDRQSMNATVHVNPANDRTGTHDLRADYTAWHIVGCRYGAGKLAWTLDGEDVGALVVNEPGKQFVPTVPMYPIFQTECGPSSTPVEAGSLLQVAWMRGLT